MTTSFRVSFQRKRWFNLVYPGIRTGVDGPDVQNGTAHQQLVDVHAVRSPLIAEAHFVDSSSMPGSTLQVDRKLVPRKDPVTNYGSLGVVDVEEAVTHGTVQSVG